MLVVTTDQIAGKEVIEVLGFVTASTVRTRHLGRDLMATLKLLVGGEVHSYTQLLTRAREDCLRSLEQDAEQLGADAIVAVRLTTSMIASGTAEIVAYGTAVRLS